MKHLLLIMTLTFTTSCTLNNCDEAYCKDLSEKMEAYIDINKATKDTPNGAIIAT